MRYRIGANDDKVAACNFDVFYGKLENAPLIRQCPVNLECKVEHILNLGSHALVVGSIEETHVSEDCLTGGNPDIEKIKPFLYSRGVAPLYYAFGSSIGDAFSIGKQLNQ
jgi:flavin reductase (DIM6/NTAB) family NADH-FMN oxidoreductase RutF